VVISLKRIVALFGTFLGTIGAAACIILIVVTWQARERLDVIVESGFGRVDETLDRLEDRSAQATQRVTDARDSLSQLDMRVQRRVAELRGMSPEEAPDLDELERRLYARVDQARDWMSMVRTSVDLVSQVIDFAQWASLFFQEDSHTVRELLATAKAGHEELELATERTEEIRSLLVDIRAKRDLDKHSEEFRSVSGRFDDSLEKIEGYAERFEAGVTKSRGEMVSIGQRLRERILTAAIVTTLVLVWMLLGQFCLCIVSWKAMRIEVQP
jgi:hypothetical protein